MIIKNEINNAKENVYSFHHQVSAKTIDPAIWTDLSRRDITV